MTCKDDHYTFYSIPVDTLPPASPIHRQDIESSYFTSLGVRSLANARVELDSFKRGK